MRFFRYIDFATHYPAMIKAPLLALIACTLFMRNSPAQIPPTPRDTTITGPQSFALIMGVSKYKYVRPLSFADKDAELFRDHLLSPAGGALKKDNIFMLTNEQALASTFWIKGFQWLRAKQLRRGDRLYIFLAGHGDAIDEDQYFFLSQDCNPAGDKNNYLVGGAIQLFNLKKKIAAETSKGVEVVFVMDACRSNELPGGQEGLNFLNSAISEKKAGEIIMLATGAGQESVEDASVGSGHGLFTWYLVDAMSGMADSGPQSDGRITVREIKEYVSKNVPAVARQRFNREQVPYFCCDESGSTTVSRVDAGYLRLWMERRNSRGGNAYHGTRSSHPFPADTLLTETYNRFNKALRSGDLEGTSSAEEYYRRLATKFPGNPFTEDAASSLASQWIESARIRVNQYLACGYSGSAATIKEHAAAAARMEKAIRLLQTMEPEYAASLRGQSYLLRSAGTESIPDALQLAHQARATEPQAAFILNWLARLHIRAGSRDSALYYAEKAAAAAPKWACALATVTAVRELPKQKDPSGKKENKTGSVRRPGGFGFTLGGGMNQSQPTYSGNPNARYSSVSSASAPAFHLGMLYQFPIGGSLSLRPTVSISRENTNIDFTVRNTSGAVQVERIAVNGTAVNMSLPILIRLSPKQSAPYLMGSAVFSYLTGQSTASANLLRIKRSMTLAEIGVGYELRLKGPLTLSPELRYTLGLTDAQDPAATGVYATALSGLKRNAFGLSLVLRLR